jgi:hypothetical protein
VQAAKHGEASMSCEVLACKQCQQQLRHDKGMSAFFHAHQGAALFSSVGAASQLAGQGFKQAQHDNVWL